MPLTHVAARWRPRLLLLPAVLASAMGLSACGIFGLRLQSPVAVLDAEPRMGPGRLTSAEIQSELMTFADTFGAVVSEAWNGVVSNLRAATPSSDPEIVKAAAERAARAHRVSLYTKLAVVRASIMIAASPNPTVALADMVTMVTLERMVLEGPRTAAVYGPAGKAALVEVFREQERRIWEVATRAMTPEQVEELHGLIDEWRAANPMVTYVANVRLEDFASARQQSRVQDERSSGSLLSLIALDPLAGLDPAQRDLQKARMLGERVFFYASRLPQLVKWQVESGYEEFFDTPEVAGLLASLQATSESVPRVAAVVERLPRDIAVEREATLQQLFEGLRTERQETVKDIFAQLTEQREGILRHIDERLTGANETLGELRETVRAADALAVSMQSVLTAAGALADRVLPPADAPPPPDKDSSGLDDYCVAMSKTADAADRLNALVGGLDGLLGPGSGQHTPPRLVTATAELGITSQAVVEHAFERLLVLAFVAPLMTALSAFLYRWAVRRSRLENPADAAPRS